MFPSLKSGLGNINDQSPEQIFHRGLAASALRKIVEQAVKDTTILMAHQYGAQMSYNEDEGIPIEEDAEGHIILYDPEEEKEIRHALITTTMRYHAIHPGGLGNKITPLINFVLTSQPVPPELLAAEPLLAEIIRESDQYKGTDQSIVQKILDFTTINETAIEQHEELVLKNTPDEVPVAIFEDDTVQCNCDYCNNIFSTAEIEIDELDLNFIQQTLLANFPIDS